MPCAGPAPQRVCSRFAPHAAVEIRQPRRHYRDGIMKREDLTEKILDIKRDRNWSWKHITSEIGGMSEILIVGALLGQMKLVKALAKKAAQLFDLSEAEERMLNEV